jgi:GTP-binding protein
MFVDRVDLYVKGGNGGLGMVSFRREKYVPRGGPDGGDGGRGGSVIVRAVANADNLAPLVHKKHWRAKNGDPGGTSLCTGKDAQDLIIPVPPGTIVRDRDRGNVLKDLVEVGDEVTVGKGGRGGRGNKEFATATNRTPREFEPGEDGEERTISLELKVIADAGLIGFPNAGKSTLLSRLSRATPEIADYPFTTKHPNLGIVALGGDAAFVLADLPGLIEGASQGVGLGHEFLRHVERTRVLIHLVEPFPSDGSDPVQNHHAIRKELTLYSQPLAEKPEVACVSKAELTGADAVRDRLAAALGREVLLISSVTGQGLSQLVGRAAQLIAEVKQQEREAKERSRPVEFPTEKAIRTGDEVTP